MTYEQADTLLYVIHNHRNVTFVKIYDRTTDAVIEYVGRTEQIIELPRHFHWRERHRATDCYQDIRRELSIHIRKTYRALSGITGKKLLLPCQSDKRLPLDDSKYIGIGLMSAAEKN